MKKLVAGAIILLTFAAGMFIGYERGVKNHLWLDASSYAWMHAASANSKDPRSSALKLAKIELQIGQEAKGQASPWLAELHPSHWNATAISETYRLKTINA